MVSSQYTPITLSGPQNKESGVAGVDDYLSSMPSLRQLQISVRLSLNTHTDRDLWLWLLKDNEATVQRVRMAFGKCEARGILSVRVADRYFVEGED